jgi:glycosyltransferase involved in cell wall biosynthesis
LIRSAILDYVGRKAGMDYFSLRMHRELCNLGVENTLYTNFAEGSDAEVRHVFPWETGQSRPGTATMRYVTGIMRTFQGIRRAKSKHFIFHYFKAGIREALVLLMARRHGQCIHLLVHDVESLDTSNNHNRLKGFIAKFLRQWIFHHACDHAYTFSQAAADELLQLEPSLRERLIVLHHGHFLDLPLPEPSREQARRDILIEEGTVTLLFFGQIKASKGPEVLLQAMEQTRDPRLRLIIAGQSRDYDIEEGLRQWTSPDTRSRIRLMNRYITDPERDMLFKACDAVVLPYHRIYNSGVLMMALSYGRPVIASDLPANREIINDERLGLLFEAGKALSLTEVLRRYLLCATPPSNSVTICSNRSEIRAILTQRFSWKDTAQGINQVIRQHAEIS